MIQVSILSEGLTEQGFLNELISSSLSSNNVKLKTINLGGINSYSKIKEQVIIESKNNQRGYITTMFDLYRLPKNFPGQNESNKINDPLERADYLENRMNDDIGCKNFFANFTVHEFEAFIFIDPNQFLNFGNDKKFLKKIVIKVKRIRQQFPTPEHINGKNAPSKRIKAIYPLYDKPKHGVFLTKAVGLEVILKECRHFRNWYEKLIQLGQEKNGLHQSENKLEIVID